MRPIAILFALALAGSASAADVDVTIEGTPRGQGHHGYSEIHIRAVNRSSEPHDVRVQFPKTSYGSGDALRSVSRTVKVEAGASVRISLAWPDRLAPYGADGLGVAVDGREWERPLPVGLSRSYRSYGAGRSPLVLYSNTVDPRVPDQMRFGTSVHEYARSDAPVRQWSANWLGYTRYDGLIVTARDLLDMPAEVKAAVGQYVECGGSMLVLGPQPQLPGNWKLTPEPRSQLPRATPGFGTCLALDDFNTLLQFGRTESAVIHETWRQSLAPFQRDQAPAEANRIFPVVDDVSVPVRGLVAVMFLFAIVIGPVNMVILARKKRKLWLFWTVPVVSFFTCLLVLGYMLVSEGWSGHSRTEGFTILDENSRRASTIGWTGFYAPITPRDGLRFSAETEAIYQNGDETYSYRRSSTGSSLSMEWSDQQNLTSGWIAPRVPSHFALRKSELRRERVTIAKGADGLPEAVNGLGASAATLWYRDAEGKLFRGENIAAGERGKLQPATEPRSTPALGLRGLFAGEWHHIVDRAAAEGPGLLAPRTYLVILDGAPFLDDGMPGASVRRAKSVVYGILKEGSDGG